MTDNSNTSKFLFETKTIHAGNLFKILEAIMPYKLDSYIDSLTPIYFYDGESDFLVEIEDNKDYTLVKFSTRIPQSIINKIEKKFLEDEKIFFLMLEELGLLNSTFLFDAKNMAIVSFEDFKISHNRTANYNDLFVVHDNKRIGIIKEPDKVFAFSTSYKTMAFDTAVLALFNKLGYITGSNRERTAIGCTFATIIAGLYEGVAYDLLVDEINMELSDDKKMTDYIKVKVADANIYGTNNFTKVAGLKTDRLKRILGKEEEPIVGEVIDDFVVKGGETAFLSRIIQIGLNVFLNHIEGGYRPINVEIDIPDIGARRITINNGAAFILPEKGVQFQDSNYWMQVFNSEHVALVMS